MIFRTQGLPKSKIIEKSNIMQLFLVVYIILIKFSCYNCTDDYQDDKKDENKEWYTIRLTHHGAYVAKFHLFWDEITISNNGTESVQHHQWYKNGVSLTAPFSEDQLISSKSRNIKVTAQECTGLFWEWWRVVFNKRSVPSIAYREFVIYGTTLNPDYSITPPI